MNAFWGHKINRHGYGIQLYSISLSFGSDVARLFAKHSAKSRAPRKIANTGSRVSDSEPNWLNLAYADDISG